MKREQTNETDCGIRRQSSMKSGHEDDQEYEKQDNRNVLKDIYTRSVCFGVKPFWTAGGGGDY